MSESESNTEIDRPIINEHQPKSLGKLIFFKLSSDTQVYEDYPIRI